MPGLARHLPVVLAALPWLLLACNPAGQLNVVGPDDDDTAADDDDDTTAAGDDDDATPPVEHVDGVEDPAGWMFTLDAVPTLEIHLEPEAIESLWTDPYTYVPGDIVFDGVLVPEVGVRLKGRIGSFRNLDAKAAFKIDLNRFVPGQTLHGLEKLTLNNMVVDCSFAKERLAFAAFAAAGVPVPRVGYVWIEVNGTPYGLYLNVETPDDVWLARKYDDPGGNLYEADYMWWPDGSYQLIDFNVESQDYFELEEGVDVGHADVHAVTEVLDHYAYQEGFYGEMDSQLDWDHHLRMVSVEQWVGQLDGYSLNTNNYRVYFDPADGKAQVLPWDLDYAFQYDYAWGMSWYTPRGRLSHACWSDGDCHVEHMQVLDDVCQVIDDQQLQQELVAIETLITSYVYQDPRQECQPHWIPYSQDVLYAWVANRSTEVRAAWGL